MGFVELQPHQIAFLQCNSQRLYAEVIQIVPDRRLCWARPLVLLNQRSDQEHFFQVGSCGLSTETLAEMLVDLRQASDLLLPLPWFQVAVDTEVIPILAQLIEPKTQTSSTTGEAALLSTQSICRPSAQEQLQQFIQDFCKVEQHPKSSS
ncbi:hypothetical protein [Leptolyngbya ohadii]|uniref:hypothetical protein n=1 Tax=Leptolyngbya ohadii TaxID=1962290 RepID=UPI000B59B5D2|nr:hypothetical protein [Leptolyngbya ohadii]